ncbi:sugar phosphate isomerase/epimerase family protein [Thalassiella azotivora]
MPEPTPRGRTSATAVSTPPASVGLSTASVYPLGCAEGFALAARLGYDGVEVMVWTDPVSQDTSALQQLSRHYDVPVLAVHAPTLLVTQRVWGREPWPKIERAAQMAVDLGARTVVAHPPFRWQREYGAGFVDGVKDVEDRYGVDVAVENMYPWRAGNREVKAYAPGWDPTQHDYRHVTLDLSHTATAGSDAFDMAVRLGDRLTHLHLADGTGSAKDEHLVPGRGGQRCEDVLGLLAQRRFAGVVVVEVNTRRCRTAPERELDLAESLAFARLSLAATPAPSSAPASSPAASS